MITLFRNIKHMFQFDTLDEIERVDGFARTTVKAVDYVRESISDRDIEGLNLSMRISDLEKKTKELEKMTQALHDGVQKNMSQFLNVLIQSGILTVSDSTKRATFFSSVAGFPFEQNYDINSITTEDSTETVEEEEE